jgi:hypothetical protein
MFDGINGNVLLGALDCIENGTSQKVLVASLSL